MPPTDTSAALRQSVLARAMIGRFTFVQAALALAIALFLLVFLAIPVFTVIYVAFTNADGSLTLSHFDSFFHLTLMRE